MSLLLRFIGKYLLASLILMVAEKIVWPEFEKAYNNYTNNINNK